MLAYTFYEMDNRVMRYAETLVNRGDHVDVISLRMEGQLLCEMIDGVNVYRIQKRLVNEKKKFTYLVRIIKFFIKSAIFLSKKHLKNPYNLIHVHNIPDFEIFAAFLPKVTGAKIILDIHDILPEFYISKFKNNKKHIIYNILKLIEKLSIKFSDHVIISNDIWKEKLLSRSATIDNCTTIMNYPDTSIFFKQKRNKKNNKFIMIYPGTLNWHQGVDIAIRAFYIIKDKIPEAEFHIYGEGPAKEYLKKLISELELNGRIYLNEYLPIKQIASIMANSDIGIVPKRNDSFGGEAFSTKILEFMSLGIPVIVSKTKIDHYYFNDSIVKFFKPDDEKDLANVMLLLIKHKELRKQLATNAILFARENNWQGMKYIYLNLVDSLTTKSYATPFS